MPPANSRATSPPAPAGSGHRAGTPPSYLSALRELESPVNSDVLNLAATLTTQVEEDATDASLSHLRQTGDDDGVVERARERLRQLDQPPESRLERTRDRLRQLERTRDGELDHRDRLRRVMNRLSRIHDPPAYGDRIPSQNNLYDWSPANEADDEDELDHILAELRREQPNTHPEILRVLGRSQLDSEREARMRASSRLLSSNQPSRPADGSLRSAAILQSVRRHPRFSARTRHLLQRYNSDRDSASRSPHHSESRDRYSSFDSARQAALQRLAERRTALERERERDRDRDRDMVARVDSYRRSYLDRSSPSVSAMLEQTIKYLSRIRSSATVEDSLNWALEAGYLSKDYFCDNENADFILDTRALPPPAATSWLAPGAVLAGCQHATTVASTVTSTAPVASTTLYRFRNNESMTSTFFEPGRQWLNTSYTSPHRRSVHASVPEVVTSHAPQQDRWPVKVTIHAVDYSRMSLSATMEAYDVPSHPHPHHPLLSNALDGPPQSFTRTSSITTYLEGEILDFNRHGLLTESFKSSASNDATYWRKLPPFQKYTDEELVRNLTSKTWYTEELNKEWILMRWKERCFVKSLNQPTASPVQPPSFSSPTMQNASFASMTSSRENYPTSIHWPGGSQADVEQSFDDSGCGLTISGFYYVCLRRSDGKLEGLYYDPQSSPYQCLKLTSVNGGVFPAWSFR